MLFVLFQFVPVFNVLGIKYIHGLNVVVFMSLEARCCVFRTVRAWCGTEVQ